MHEKCVVCGKNTAWEERQDLPIVINNRIRWLNRVRVFYCDACDEIYFDDAMSKEYAEKLEALKNEPEPPPIEPH